MVMLLKGIVVALALLPVGSMIASAQSLAPGNPDVVMECFRDNKPAEACTFQCGTELVQGGGKEVIWGNVSRVEFYHKGSSGRADTRSWVFVRARAGGNASPPFVVGLYLGPRYFCMATQVTKIGEPPPTIPLELRITKFDF
jgi:hypothetical protein